jgi:hypothetical protein
MLAFNLAGVAAPKGWLSMLTSSISALGVTIATGLAAIPSARAIASEIMKEQDKKRAQACIPANPFMYRAHYRPCVSNLVDCINYLLLSL